MKHKIPKTTAFYYDYSKTCDGGFIHVYKSKEEDGVYIYDEYRLEGQYLEHSINKFTADSEAALEVLEYMDTHEECSKKEYEKFKKLFIAINEMVGNDIDNEIYEWE